jgi:hypothetical protein
MGALLTLMLEVAENEKTVVKAEDGMYMLRKRKTIAKRIFLRVVLETPYSPKTVMVGAEAPVQENVIE